MVSIQVEILNPEARSLLEELAKLKLILITDLDDPKSQFAQLVKKLRDRNTSDLSLEDITKEVESVRSERFKGKKRNWRVF